MEIKQELFGLFGEMITQIKQKVKVYAIICFGSRARGNARPNSDYDFVIIADFKEPYLDRSDWILDFTPFISMDLFCYTPSEFEELFSSYHLTAIDDIGEGIILDGDIWVRPYQERFQRLVKKGLRKTESMLIVPMMDEFTPFHP
jgi:predicted nucleotidyltransferase